MSCVFRYPTGERHYKPGEVAKILQVSISTLQHWDRSGKFPARHTLTGRRYYTEQDLSELIERCNK